MTEEKVKQKNINKASNGKEGLEVPFQLALESSFGAAAFLAGRAESHKFLFAQDFEWLIMAPIALKQFRIFRDDKKNIPLGFVSWAKVSDEVEKRLLSGNRKLAPKDWQSGDKVYLIDIITPFLNQRQILEQISEGELKDQNIYTTRKTKDGKGFEAIELRDLLKESNKDS